MYDDHDIKPGPRIKPLGVDDPAQLPLQPVPHHRALHAAPGPQTDARDAQGVREHTDGERQAADPSSPSVDGVEGLGVLELRFRGCGEARLGRDELPAAFSSTTVQRASSAARLHAPHKAVDLLPLPVRLVRQMLFHVRRHYTNRATTNQGETACWLDGRLL